MADISIDVKKMTDGFNALTKAIESLDNRLGDLSKNGPSALDMALGSPKTLKSYIDSISRLDNAVGKSFSSIIKELRLFTETSKKTTKNGFAPLIESIEAIVSIANKLSFSGEGAVNTDELRKKIAAIVDVKNIIEKFGKTSDFDAGIVISLLEKIRGTVDKIKKSHNAIFNLIKSEKENPQILDSIKSYANIIREFSKTFGGNMIAKYQNVFDRIARRPIDYEGVVNTVNSFLQTVKKIEKVFLEMGKMIPGDNTEKKAVRKKIDSYAGIVKYFTKAFGGNVIARYSNIINEINGIEIDYEFFFNTLNSFSKNIRNVFNLIRDVLDFTALRVGTKDAANNALEQIDDFSSFVRRFVRNMTNIIKNNDIVNFRALEMAVKGTVESIIGIFNFFENNPKIKPGHGILTGNIFNDALYSYIDKTSNAITRLTKAMPKNVRPEKIKAVSLIFKTVTNSFPQMLDNAAKLESMFSIIKIKKEGFPISTSIFAKPNQLFKRMRFFSVLTTYTKSFSRLSNKIPNKEAMVMASNSLKNFASGFNELQNAISELNMFNVAENVSGFLSIDVLVARLRRFFKGINSWNVRRNDANKVLAISNGLATVVNAVKEINSVFDEMTPLVAINEKIGAYNKRVRFLGVVRVIIKDLLGIMQRIASSLKERPDELASRLKTFSLAIKNLAAGIRGIILAQQELQGMFDEVDDQKGPLGRVVKFGQNSFSFITNAFADIAERVSFGKIRLNFIRTPIHGMQKLLKQFDPLLKLIERFSKRLSKITQNIQNIEKISELSRAMASIKRFLEFVGTIEIDTRGRLKRFFDSVRSGFGIFSWQNKNNMFEQAKEAVRVLKPFTKIVKSLKNINTGVIREFFDFITKLNNAIKKGVFNFDFSKVKMAGFDNWAKEFSTQMQGGIRTLSRMKVNAKQIEKAKNAILLAQASVAHAQSMDVNKRKGFKGRLPTLMPEAENDRLTENDLIRRGFAQRTGEMRRDYLQRIINDLAGPLIRTIAFANPFNVVKNLQRQIMTVFKESGKVIGEYANQVASGARNMMQMFSPEKILRSQGFNLAVDYDALSSQLKVFGNLNAEQLALAQQMANEIGVKYPLSANEALVATLDLLKAGQGLSEVQFILPASANLAALSESGDLENVTKFLIGATNGYRKFSDNVASSFNNIDVATDIVFRAANDSTASVDSLMEALLRAAPSASAFGLSLEETAALLTIFEDAGIRGQEAGTQLRAVLDELTMNGMNSREVLDLVLSGKTPTGLFEERFERQGLRILQSATAQGNGIKAITERYREMGTAADASSSLMDNLRGDIEQLKGSFETALTVAFIPTLERFFRPIVKVLRMVVDGFTGMNPVLRDTIINGSLVTVVGMTLGSTLVFVAAKTVALSGWFMHLVGTMGLAIMKAPIFITSLGGIAVSFSVLAAGAASLSAIFFFLSDAITQTFVSIEKNIAGAGDSFSKFTLQVRAAFNEMNKLFGRVKASYKTVFEKDDIKALNERGQIVSNFFTNTSKKIANFTNSIRRITTRDILIFLENTKLRLRVIRGIFQDLRIGWLGLLTGQGQYLWQFRVGLSKILYSFTDFIRKTTKNENLQSKLMEAMINFQHGKISSGIKILVTNFVNGIKTAFLNSSEQIGGIAEFIFNAINPFRRLEAGLRIFGQRQIADELKVINDQFAQGFRGIVLTITNIMGGKSLVEAIRAGFGIRGAEFVRQSIGVFQKLANAIRDIFRQIGITISFNPLKGLINTLKSIPFSAVQGLIDSFKAFGKVVLSAIGGDIGAVAKISALSAAIITLVGPKVMGKFQGAFNTLKKFAKFLLIFEVIEAVTKNLDTLLNKNFFEGLTGVIAELSMGLLELLGLDEESMKRVREFFDELSLLVQSSIAAIERMVTDIVLKIEDLFPTIFPQSERSKQIRKDKKTIDETKTILYTDIGEQAVEEGFGNMLRRVGVDENTITLFTDQFRTAASQAAKNDNVLYLFDFFNNVLTYLKSQGLSDEQLKPFLTLRNDFNERHDGQYMFANVRNILSGGEYANTVGRQEAILAYGRTLAGMPEISSFDALSQLSDIAKRSPGEILLNRDLTQKLMERISSETGIENLTAEQATQALTLISASGETIIQEWLPRFAEKGFANLFPKIFDSKTIAPYMNDLFRNNPLLKEYKFEDKATNAQALAQNLGELFETEQELNVTVPEEVIREQIYNGLKAGGTDFTNETLRIADMVSAVDTGAATYSASESIKLLDSLAKATTDSERASLLAGKTIEQVVVEAIAGVESSPRFRSEIRNVASNIAKVMPQKTSGERQKQAAALSVLYGNSSRFTGEVSEVGDGELFTPMEKTNQSRKGLIDLFDTVKKMTPEQVANNFQAIARNLQDMGIFASENSDILSLFLEQLNGIYETNPELGNMGEAFSTLQTNIEIANKTLEQMGITVDSPTYQEELTKLLQQLGSLDEIGNIIIPITVTGEAENLIGGLTPEEIQRMADLANLIDDYSKILAGVSTGVVEATKTADELIQEYASALKDYEAKVIDTEKEITSMRAEFMESEAEAEFNYNKERKRALEDHLKEMKEIGENDFKEAVANRNAASALEAMKRQKDAKAQFEENEKRANEDYQLERQKALKEHELKLQSARNELELERQKLETLKRQRDDAIRVQLAQYQQEYDALVAKANASANTNNSIVTNTETTMQQVANSIAENLNEALQTVTNSPIAQAFEGIISRILETVNATMINRSIVQQAGFSGNQYNKPELNPNKGVVVIPPSFGGGRAEGGKLMANRWYITGEDGPEPLFMGSRSGYIATMKDVMKYQRPSLSASGSSVNINVDLSNMQINGVQNANDIVRQIEERVVKGITQAFRKSV